MFDVKQNVRLAYVCRIRVVVRVGAATEIQSRPRAHGIAIREPVVVKLATGPRADLRVHAVLHREQNGARAQAHEPLEQRPLEQTRLRRARQNRRGELLRVAD